MGNPRDLLVAKHDYTTWKTNFQQFEDICRPEDTAAATTYQPTGGQTQKSTGDNDIWLVRWQSYERKSESSLSVSERQSREPFRQC